MNFAHGQILWLLPVFLPALVAFFWWATRERQRAMTQFIQARLLPGLVSGLSPVRQKIRYVCLTLAVALIIVTLARLQWGFTWEESKQRGLDIVVAIDTSKSMLAEDIAPNRLARAKLAALDLMQHAKSDRLGLVAFAGSAFLQCPLTIDDNAFRQSVEALDVNIIPQGGTALAEAINTALSAFKEGDNFKVLVVFTDGEDNDEGALEAAQKAAKEGMKIFTIGIGTEKGEVLRVKDAKGRIDYIRDAEGNAVASHLNEPLLQQIAGATDGGFYLPLRGAKTMDTLYENGLAPLPKSEGQEKLVRRPNERYHWPLSAAILLLFFEMLLPERRREKERRTQVRLESNSAPGDQRADQEIGAPTAMLAIFALLALPNLALASPATALRDFNAGNFDSALKEYQQAMEKQKDDPRLQFNAGAAAYRATNYALAAKYFTTAANAQDVKLQQAAYYNLGNTQFRAGAMTEELDALQAQWEAAAKSFESAVKLDKNDADAAHNLTFVKSGIEQLKQLREIAKRMRAEADQSLRRRAYHRALEIMEPLVQQNIAAKPFQEFTKKLKNIDDIATPTPAPVQP
ncbi:MAG: VWA domain-containing protein [Pedosphaera sp.]|nr:VWA domain-containing protein [Pedosphaera sp.]